MWHGPWIIFIDHCRIPSINFWGKNKVNKFHATIIWYLYLKVYQLSTNVWLVEAELWNAPLQIVTDKWLFDERSKIFFFLSSPSIEKEENRKSMLPKKKEIWRKKRRRPHVGNCAESTEKPASTTGIPTPPFHQASCRHLRYMRMFRAPITPPGITWQSPFNI